MILRLLPVSPAPCAIGLIRTALALERPRAAESIDGTTDRIEARVADGERSSSSFVAADPHGFDRGDTANTERAEAIDGSTTKESGFQK
jgi:hypothetical protein